MYNRREKRMLFNGTSTSGVVMAARFSLQPHLFDRSRSVGDTVLVNRSSRAREAATESKREAPVRANLTRKADFDVFVPTVPLSVPPGVLKVFSWHSSDVPNI